MIKELAIKIDNNKDEKYQKEELVNFIKNSIKNYTSNFADMDIIEEDMTKYKDLHFMEMTHPKHFWVTFMEGEAAQ